MFGVRGGVCGKEVSEAASEFENEVVRVGELEGEVLAQGGNALKARVFKKFLLEVCHLVFGGRGFCPPRVIAPEFPCDREGGNEDDGDDDGVEISFHDFEPAKAIPCVGERVDPEEAADDVVCDEPRVVHFPDAGDEGDEGAHDGDETGEDDGAPAVFFKEDAGAFEVFFAEEEGVFACENLGADF